jgi:Phage gp6-like head-tail connector protein
VTLTFSRVTLAGPLLTLAEAKAHLYITDSAHDADVTQKLDAAQERILAMLGPAADATWTPATAPLFIKHAILMLLAHLYENRGDDLANNRAEATIWKELQNALSFYRDPGLA